MAPQQMPPNVEELGHAAYIWYPSREQQTQSIATGAYCTNYKAQVEAIILAANAIRSRVGHNTQVVFLTDALSVLQALNSGQLLQLEIALHNIQCLRTMLQWIPSHCSIEGNEQADMMAKIGARDEQPQNPVCLAESKTIIKALYKKTPPPDSYHSLTRQDQVTIFRLRTGY